MSDVIIQIQPTAPPAISIDFTKLKYRKLSAFNIITLFSSEDGDDDADEVGPPVDTTGETEDIPIGG
jgi:hypothetical protein